MRRYWAILKIFISVLTARCFLFSLRTSGFAFAVLFNTIAKFGNAAVVMTHRFRFTYRFRQRESQAGWSSPQVRCYKCSCFATQTFSEIARIWLFPKQLCLAAHAQTAVRTFLAPATQRRRMKKDQAPMDAHTSDTSAIAALFLCNCFGERARTGDRKHQFAATVQRKRTIKLASLVWLLSVDPAPSPFWWNVG